MDGATGVIIVDRYPAFTVKNWICHRIFYNVISAEAKRWKTMAGLNGVEIVLFPQQIR